MRADYQAALAREQDSSFSGRGGAAHKCITSISHSALGNFLIALHFLLHKTFCTCHHRLNSLKSGGNYTEEMVNILLSLVSAIASNVNLNASCKCSKNETPVIYEVPSDITPSKDGPPNRSQVRSGFSLNICKICSVSKGCTDRIFRFLDTVGI